MNDSRLLAVKRRKLDNIDVLHKVGGLHSAEEPGAAPVHRKTSGKELGVGCGLFQRRFRGAYACFLKVDPALDACHGLRQIITGGLLVLGDHAAACREDRVVNSGLGIKARADTIYRTVVLGQGSGLFRHIFPGPVVGRIFHACFIKDCLVVPYTDGIEILRKRILCAADIVQGHKAGRIVCRIDSLFFNHVVDRHKDSAVRVLGDIRAVHPEYIRDTAAGCRSFQLGPVFIPGVRFQRDRHVRIHLVELFDTLLDIRSLIVIPVRVAHFSGNIRIRLVRENRRRAGQHDACHDDRKPCRHPFSDTFHNTPFFSFSGHPLWGTLCVVDELLTQTLHFNPLLSPAGRNPPG